MPSRRDLLMTGAAVALGVVLGNILDRRLGRVSARTGSDLPKILADKVRQNVQPIQFVDGTFTGSGWDLLVQEGQRAQFFMLGEEHGLDQVPVLARQLWSALQPSGYQRLALEISPPTATDLDQAARSGVDGLRRFYAENPPGPAFYTLAQEAALLAAVRQSVDSPDQIIWGFDYEVLTDRRLIARLVQKAPPAAAQAVAALQQASAKAWADLAATGNPAVMFSFAGDPGLVAAVRAAWPNPDAESDLILTTLTETLEINALFVKGQGWASNQRRAAFNRANFQRYWQTEKAAGRAPRTLFKFGANHMLRGRNMTEVLDLGSLIAETAAIEGGHSFNLMVAAGTGRMAAQFNPVNQRYVAAPANDLAEEGVGFLAGLVPIDGAAVLDLRPLRPLLSADKTTHADARMVRIIHGFDALLILGGANPSTDLIL